MNPHGADDTWLGQTMGGKFRLDRRLGEGGFGTAYLAADLNYEQLMGGERLVVVKIPRLDRLGDGNELSKDFRKEARALTQLEHAHIVKVLDVVTQTVRHLGREREAATRESLR
jgi:serine/threonine protein kinase